MIWCFSLRYAKPLRTYKETKDRMRSELGREVLSLQQDTLHKLWVLPHYSLARKAIP